MASEKYNGPYESELAIFLSRHRQPVIVMEIISIEKVKALAERKGLRPAKLKGTTGISLTKGNPRMDPITWDEFETALAGKGLAVYESRGWMKIMKA